MSNIDKIIKDDLHLRNMIEDYYIYLKDSNISLVSIQHLLFIKYNIKMDLNEIIDTIKKK